MMPNHHTENAAPKAPFARMARARYRVLVVVSLVYAMNIADRYVLSTLIEPIKSEFHLSDSAVGFLTGAALGLFYSIAGLPLGTLADRSHRRNMIAWALAVWSIFTALSGLAQNFWQLLLSRIGVGISQSGATPASHSVLADYFAPSERIIAMSIFSLGITFGMGLGGVGGGLIAEHFGWRWSLIIFALAALPVLIVLTMVKEPVRGSLDADMPSTADAPTLWSCIQFVKGHRALRHIMAGATIATFAGQGLTWWTPAFLTRSHGLGVGDAGLEIGLMNGVGGTIALMGTALVTIRLARKHIRHQCHFVAAVTVFVTITAMAAHAANATAATIVLLWLFVPFVSVHVGPTLALMQNLTPPNMRGSTVAVFLFGANVAGLVLAPQLIGLASDMIATHLAAPEQSLRVALTISALTGFWAAYHFWAAARALPEHPV